MRLEVLLMLELPAAELDGIEVAGFYQDLQAQR